MRKLSLSKLVCVVLVFCAAMASSSPAQTFTTQVVFDGTNGWGPTYMSLIQGTDGNFYGTTFGDGGASGSTIFKITPAGTLATLYTFGVVSTWALSSGLVQGTDGNFYGTTQKDGANHDGTIFKITPGGTLTTLHSFDGTDGIDPFAALVQGADGNFYGTTPTGGVSGGYGTVFKITPGGTLTTLHSFDGNDGSFLFGGLVQGTDGNFYGTTSAGGNFSAGTVFKITAGGTLTTLYSFCAHTGCTDGENPRAALVQGTGGDLYGTTVGGGAHNDGTVFKITPGSALTTLHSFTGADGSTPYSGLVQATDANFYGTASRGGNFNAGTVFKITSGGTLTTLHSFDASGWVPYGALVQATNGNFYGTTDSGGDGGGTVFSLGLGLGPFVKTEPTSGGVGAAIVILGNNLTGATGVTFNGTAAAFTVVSSSEIETTVPAGATTGMVEVTTLNGTLESNVSFQVTGSGPTTGNPASQAITFGALSNVILGAAPFTIGATASSGLAVTFASTTASVCTLSGNTVTIVAVGTCSIAASQAGNANYAAATPVVQSFSVNPAGGAGLTWILSDASFNDGGTATGYFEFDPDTRIVSNWNIVTSAGSTLPAFTYTPANSTGGATPGSGCPAPCISFGSNATFPNGLAPPYNFNEYRGLNLTFVTPLTDAGGTVDLNLKASDECLNCDPYRVFTQGFVQAVVSGAVTPSIASGGIVPVDSTVPTIQPGEWVSIFGTNLAGSTVTWNGNFPISLGGTSVTIDGKSAYLSFVSPTQINLQAPNDTATGPVPVVVTTAHGTAASTVTLAPFGPSFLLLDRNHVAGIVLRSSGSGAYGGGSYDIIGPTGSSLGYPTVAAKAGDNVVLFAVGLGPTTQAVLAGQAFSGAVPTTNSVSLLINKLSATPSFAGLSSAGLYQINLTLPAGLGTGDVSIVATVGGAQTPVGAVISLQAAAVTPLVQNLTFSPGSVASGGTATGSVVLTAPAPAGGAVVTLSSGSSAASVPASVTVPAGATSATFTVSTGTVSSGQTVTITASYGGSSAQASLTVGPPANSQCTNVGGNWNASESGSMTVTIVATAETDSETDPVSGKGSVTIAQTGCSIQYAPLGESGLIGTNLTPSQLASLTRTGTVSGNNVSITGLLGLVDTVASAQAGFTVDTVSSNVLNGTGQVAGNVITLNETGTFVASGTYSISGQTGSFTETITTSSTATFDWASGVRPTDGVPPRGLSSDSGSASSVEIRVVPDRAGPSPAGQGSAFALIRTALRKALVFAVR